MDRRFFDYYIKKFSKNKKHPKKYSRYSSHEGDDSNKTNKRIVLSKKSYKIVIILISTVLFVTLGMNIRNLSPSNVVDWWQGTLLSAKNGDGYPSDIVGAEISAGNFRAFDNDISYVSDTSFVVLNKRASKDANRNHKFSNPIYKTTNNYALIYNLGGKEFQVEKKSQTVFKGKLESNIISGSVSSNGKCAFITESSDYLSEMIILCEENGEIQIEYKYYFSEYYITNAAINGDGKSGVVSGVYSDSGALKSAIYIFNFSEEKPKNIIEYKDNIIIDLEYSTPGKVVAVGDKLVSFINTSKANNKDYLYENKSIVSYEINDNGIGLALSETTAGGNGQIVVLNLNADVKSKIDTDMKINSISVHGNKIAVLSDSQITEYTYNGHKKKTLKVSGESRKIKLTQGSKLYILGICKINLLHLS